MNNKFIFAGFLILGAGLLLLIPVFTLELNGDISPMTGEAIANILTGQENQNIFLDLVDVLPILLIIAGLMLIGFAFY